ncbi:MAG: FtsX-like permease family protein [Bacteroidaceae bacterium]|nr:FtsX-like permease family protein [Bacteroidaceae bacterium]
MFFVAKRIYQGGEAGRASASAVRIATAGVAVGILVMIISICVTIGFQREIKGRVASLVGHIQVVNSETLYRNNPAPIEVSDSLCREISALHGVTHVQRFALCMGMLKTEHTFRGIYFRGVDSSFDPSFLADNLVSGSVPSFGQGDAPSDSILLSASMASALQVEVGQKIYAYFFDKNLRARRFVVSGVFQTNMADFDDKMCFADVRTVQRLSGWEGDQYSGAEVILDDFSSMDTVGTNLSSMFYMKEDAYGHYYATPRVDELFPQVFSWLTLLDTNVVAILILMICVASVTMVSGLLIIILERTRFIGVMKAMGATNSQLRSVFLYLSAMIVVRGLLFGNIIAFALLFIQHATGIVALDPESYYLARVPVYFPVWGIVLVNVITLVVCVLVLIVPTHVVSRIQPARSIRFE